MRDPTSRLLQLLALLQTHRDWAGPELAGRLGVTVRTVRRDVERLRELGYPVDAARGVAGGYRLGAGTTMPPLLLDDDEAVAIAVGLRTTSGSVSGLEETAARALAKLEQVLPPKLRRRVNALQSATVALRRGGDSPSAVDAAVLSALAFACRDRERVRFRYAARDGSPSTRMVEPHRLVSAGRRWYLVAWDVERSAWRTFRVDRLEPPQPTGLSFTPRPIPTGDAATFLARSLAEQPTRFSAEVVVHAPMDVVTERLWATSGTLEPIDGGSCRLLAGADSLEWLAVSLLMLDADFEVRAPAELVEQVRLLAGRCAAAAAD